ncbi:NfeD family protein [Youxingia wuxianensis]|uniref:NfeD family protein n=1 Tax=Youxingia wuxianensis TaxID=2763678 RepID=A0A926IIP6_9FIRM|nr:NfeD family protein [Youxingia wuxianensis]MBC8585898.1 NfeD family protein [Youxingia wuxianensis]
MNVMGINFGLTIFWLVVGIVMVAIEAATAQLTTIWFAIGAFLTIIPAALNAPVWLQFVIFTAISLVTLIFTRKFVKRALKVKKESTNADRVIGQTGYVTQTIDNDMAQGRVSVMGLDWSARSADNTDISIGEKIKVRSIDGVKLIVEKADVREVVMK